MLLVQLMAVTFGSHPMKTKGMHISTSNVTIAYISKLLAALTINSLIFLLGKQYKEFF